jgi:lysophospholipase L1-like esterase
LTPSTLSTLTANNRQRAAWRRSGFALAVALAALTTTAQAAGGFVSTQPTPRVEYWQTRQADIDKALQDRARMAATRLVFVGDSITDFWLLADDPWIPGRMHGRRVWDESFAGAVSENVALNIGISGDRTEHLLFRILPKSLGGLGQLDAEALAPEFFVLMIGINNSYAPEPPVADSVFEGVLAVMRSLHARKPGVRLLLQSILPTSEPARDDAVVKPVNARLAALAKSPEFAGFTTWLDLYPSFVDAQGRQDTRLFVDGLHPSEAGYRLWRDWLVPFLQAERQR